MDPAVPALVLLVEDEFLVRRSTASLLEDAGFRVLEARDAKEAVNALETHPDVRVLFTDMDLPGLMGGVELAHKIHAELPNVHLILTSGKTVPSMNDIPHKGRFIAKPYSTDLLARMMRAMLKI